MDPPTILHEMTTEEFRRSLSQIINRAAYGIDPVLITRRGSKIAAVISMDDFILLEKARRARGGA
jgi:prevent-host-death family protein